jgi:hypothetical protein
MREETSTLPIDFSQKKKKLFTNNPHYFPPKVQPSTSIKTPFPTYDSVL